MTIKRFTPDETRPAGYGFQVPAAERHIRDKKPSRPFLLLTRSNEPELATLALMTSKSTEEQYGATLYEFPHRRGRMKLPGQESSYTDLSSFLFRATHRLREAKYNHARSMPGVRTQLKIALGFGTGIGSGLPKTSIRGHVVRLTQEMATQFEFEFGIVLTQHTYSASRRIQALAPVVDLAVLLPPEKTRADFEPAPGDVLPASDAPWLAQLPSTWLAPVIDTERFTSFSERWEESTNRGHWLGEQIKHVFPTPTDSTTLTAVETTLARRFQLSP